MDPTTTPAGRRLASLKYLPAAIPGSAVLRKGLGLVEIEGEASPGAEITANGRSAGTLFTRSGDRAIAYLRFDRAGKELEAGSARLKFLSPA